MDLHSDHPGFRKIIIKNSPWSTTLAHILAEELGVSLKVSSGPVIDKPGDLAGLLTSLESRDVLFIDEIHRLSPVVEEYLYSAMEFYLLTIKLI